MTAKEISYLAGIAEWLNSTIDDHQKTTLIYKFLESQDDLWTKHLGRGIRWSLQNTLLMKRRHRPLTADEQKYLEEASNVDYPRGNKNLL